MTNRHIIDNRTNTVAKYLEKALTIATRSASCPPTSPSTATHSWPSN